MSDPTLNLPIRSTFDASGTDAAQRALAQLQQAQQKAQPKAGGDSDPFAGVSKSAAAAERDTLRYATAMAQAQRATGDTAGAVETMRAAVGQLTPNTIEAHQATTRLAQAEQALQKELSGGASLAQQFGSSLSSSLMGIVGPAAAAGVAIGALSKAGELIQLGAQAEQTRARFNQLAAQAHTTGDAMMVSLRQMSGGTISDTNLQLAAMKANILGVAKNADQLGPLLAIARDRAQQMGISTEFAFDSLVTGLGRGSRLILDNIGVMVKEGEVNAAYAASVGKSVSALTDQEKKQALVNEVIRQGNETIAQTGGALDGTATRLERVNTNLANIKANVGSGLANLFDPAIEGLARVTSGSEGQAQALQSLENAAVRLQAAEAGMTEEEFRAATASEASKAAAEADATAKAQQAAQAQVNQAAAAAEDAQMMALVDTTALHSNEAVLDAQASALQAQGIQQAAIASQIDSQAKTEQAAQTELVKLQTQAAADAFIALHPNMSATALASLAAAQGMSPLIVQLIRATAEANAATNALRLFQIAAGNKVNAASVNTTVAQNRTAGRMGRGDSSDALEASRAATAEAKKQTDANLALARAKGDVATQVSILRAQQKGLNVTDAEYKQIEAQILSVQKSGARGGRGGAAKGPDGLTAAARQKQAVAGGERLEDIARTSGNKLADIDEQTQQKLAQIEQKYAAQRLAAQRQLADDIATANADTNFDQQLNDFDKFQKDLSADQKAALDAREAAEAEYNQKVAAAQEEARAAAQNGDAQLAEDILKAKTDQAKKEKEIAERAAEAQRNGGNKAAIATEVAEAKAAAQQIADTEIAIAQAKAQERAGAEQSEKDAVIAQAEEQKAKVIAAAEESAAKVKGASDSQKAAVIAALKAQADAAKEWADAMVGAAGRAQDAMGGVTGPPAPGEGGDTGGDTGGEGVATGGGSGQGLRAAGGMGGDVLGTLQDVINFIEGLLPLITHHNKLVKELRTYAHTLQSTIDVIGDLVNLRKNLAQPIPALKPEAIAQLVEDFNVITRALGGAIDAKAAKQAALFQHLLEADQQAIAILQAILDLRQRLSGPQPGPIPVALVQALAAEAQAIALVVQTQIVTANKKLTTNLKLWAEIVSASIGVLNDVSDLRKTLSENAGAPPIDMSLVRALAAQAAQIAGEVNKALIPYSEAQTTALEHYAGVVSSSVSLLKDTADLKKELAGSVALPAIDMKLVTALAQTARQVATIVMAALIPLSEEQASGLERYASSVGAAVSILKDIADLKKEMAGTAATALDLRAIAKLADEARQIAGVVLGRLLPLSEEQAAAMERYGQTEGAAVDVLKNVADLKKELGSATPGLDIRAVTRLADDAKRITQIFLARVLPTSEEQSEAAKLYAETVGASTEAIKDTLGLTANLFADYKSPTDAQIAQLAKDADRIVRGMVAAAKTYDTKGLEAAKLFTETVGGTFDALNGGLEFMDRLRFSDLAVDPRQLAMFQRSALQVLDATDVLAARAAQIPPANLAALEAANSAASSTADVLIKMAAVPANVPPVMGRGVAGGGGGAASYTVNIYNPPANLDRGALMGMVNNGLRRAVAMRG